MTTLVAFVATTVRVEVPPLATAVGFAVMETVGNDANTVTVTVAVIVPPGPVAVAVYVVVCGTVTDCVPPAADKV
jgi:hypothetical protein